MTISPTIEYNNFFFADDIFSGFPEEVIHCIPEIIINTTAKITAEIKSKFKPVLIILLPESSSLPLRVAGIPVGAFKLPPGI